MKANSRKLTVEQVIKAIDGSQGILYKIAQRCRVVRHTLYDFIKENPQLNKYIEAERERVIDLAEQTIYDLAKDTNPRNVVTRLKAAEKIVSTKGKDRGWVEKTITETTDNTESNVKERLQRYEKLLKEEKEAVKEVLWGKTG